jgi:hypothetical protein
MTHIHRVGGLSPSLNFQRRNWVVQRVGWVAIALILLAAILGLFGSGPLSWATAGQQGDLLWVTYPRFGRWQSPMSLHVNLSPQTICNGQIRLWLSRAYLNDINVQQVTPQPQHVEVEPKRLIYIFSANQANGSILITFSLKPNTFGSVPARIGLDHGPAIEFSQFLYP